MNRLLPWVVVALLGILVWNQHGTIGDLKDQVSSMATDLKNERAKVAALRKQVQQVATKGQTDRLKIKEVLDEAPAFRDTPVPEPVRTGLCSVIRCK